MKVIQIRNVPDDVHRALRTRAAAAGVSLSDFALEELTTAVGTSPAREILRRALGRPNGTTTEAVIAAIRATREPS